MVSVRPVHCTSKARHGGEEKSRFGMTLSINAVRIVLLSAVSVLKAKLLSAWMDMTTIKS